MTYMLLFSGGLRNLVAIQHMHDGALLLVLEVNHTPVLARDGRKGQDSFTWREGGGRGREEARRERGEGGREGGREGRRGRERGEEREGGRGEGGKEGGEKR